MSTERRFLIAPSLARLIQREQGTTARIVEAYFPPRSDQRQLVRVAQHRAHLILLTQAQDGHFAEEQIEIPRPHAEALVDVAAGTVAFDRMSLSLGGDIEGTLDHFIIPQGLNLLTVTIPSNPHAFAPLPWFGLEVTGEPAFAAIGLALEGVPNVDPVEPTNTALEALLDTLEGRSLYHLRPAAQTGRRETSDPASHLPSLPPAAGLEAFVRAPLDRPVSPRRVAEAAPVDAQEGSYESSSDRRTVQFSVPRLRTPG